MIVTIQTTSGYEFSASSEDSILEGAQKAGVNFPYSCKNGRCSSCKCRVLQGKTFPHQPELTLSEKERNEGWILSCVRSALTDAILEIEDISDIKLPERKTLPCRISRIHKLSSDVIRVFLRLPPTAEFTFIPGQYIEVIGSNGIRRSYSLANASFAEKLLELHIRLVEDGSMSQYWFSQAKVNDLLRLYGPLGTFFLRDMTGIDLIFLATGTGIAPVKAMLESMADIPASQRPRSVTVFWGGRILQDLYFDVENMPGEHIFIPVLSRADSDWSGAHGYVQQALLSTKPDLSNSAVYACGSNAMIHGAKEALTQAGLTLSRFYSDAFVCSGTS